MNRCKATAPQKRPDSCPAWRSRADGLKTFVEKPMLQSWTALRHPQFFLGRSALRKRLTLACLAGALACSLGGVPAYAADDDDEAFELQFLKRMFGITDQAPIDYRE